MESDPFSTFPSPGSCQMEPPLTFLLIALLILASAFLSLSEISMAAARRMRLLQRAAAGDARAMSALQIQEEPGNYFTVVQIGQNMVAILGGIVGEGALTPYFVVLLEHVASPGAAAMIGFVASRSEERRVGKQWSACWAVYHC